MESVTKIENSAFWGCVNLKTIRGYAGSYAESYAKEYGYIFEDVEGKITTSYRTHVQSFGWQNPVTNGAMSGTSGKAKRLEAIQIKLYGEMANHFDVYYRVHAQSYGWLGEERRRGRNCRSCETSGGNPDCTYTEGWRSTSEQL